MEDLIRPDLMILGGGGVKNPDNFEQYLNTRTPVEFAKAGNRAGIIGAALSACHSQPG
jgi:polyphosphate glucokinase